MRPSVAISATLAVLPHSLAPAFACGPMATLSFVDSSPGDQFEIRNNSSGEWQLVQLALAPRLRSMRHCIGLTSWASSIRRWAYVSCGSSNGSANG